MIQICGFALKSIQLGIGKALLEVPVFMLFIIADEFSGFISHGNDIIVFIFLAVIGFKNNVVLPRFGKPFQNFFDDGAGFGIVATKKA